MIVEEGQISKAAKKLHMAQPPLSQQLKLLEERLGVVLFERNNRKMELTEAGRVLYEKGKLILKQLEDAILEVQEIEQGIRGVISLGCVKSCFPYLQPTIKNFFRNYPHFKLHVKEGDTFIINEFLQNGDIEIGIIRLPLENADFSMIQLPSDPYVAVFPKNWFSRSTIHMAELKDVPLLLLHRVSGTGQYELFLHECKRHHFEPNILFECPDVTILLSLVAAEVGVTIVPKSAAMMFEMTGLHIADIVDASIRAEAAVIYDKNRYLSKSAATFLDMLLDENVKNGN